MKATIPQAVSDGQRHATKRELQRLGYSFSESMLGPVIYAPEGGSFSGGTESSRLKRATEHAMQHAAKGGQA